MSGGMLEILDVNIVILPEEPLTQVLSSLALFEDKDLAPLMRKPITLGQGLIFDTTLGIPVGMYQFESMRSQKAIHLSPVRIEIHDRSGETKHLPETVQAMVTALHIEQIKAIGINWETSLNLPEGVSASAVIAEKLLRQDTSFLPSDMKRTGGSARLILMSDSGVQYTLGIEPRGQNATTDELLMTCNAHIDHPETPSSEFFEERLQQSYQLLFGIKESLFSTY